MKLAQTPVPTPSDLPVYQNNVLIDNTLRSLAAASIAGVGVGAGFRGLLGLRDILERRKAKPIQTAPRRLVLEVPAAKAAEATEVPVPASEQFAASRPFWTRWAMRRSTPGGGTNPPKYWLGQGRVGGKPPKGPWSEPLTTTAMLGGAGLSTVGGYKLVDWLLRSNRRGELEDELDEAKQEYRGAILGQRQPVRGKLAEAETTSPLCERLGTLWDQFQYANVKQAEDHWWDHLPEYALNVGLPVSLFTGGLSGTVVYKAMKAQQQRKLLEEATKVRNRRNWYTRPPELEAVLSPAESAAT